MLRYDAKNRRAAALGALTFILTLTAAGCASHGGRAPVVERTSVTPVSSARVPAAPSIATRNESGRPGYYVVKRGDTLHQIALDEGLDWHDLVRWNNLEDPSRIQVGQSLRVNPPEASDSALTNSAGANAQAAPVQVGAAGPAARPLDSSVTSAPKSSEATQPTSSSRPLASQTPTPAATPRETTTAANNSADRLDWGWPINTAGASVKVLAEFSEGKNKGLDLGGRLGDAVLAAADGKVVYSGSGLRGYGNLIIIKHNAMYLSTYAHNQSLLVQEGASVRRGQQIAQLGSSDTDKPKLHFEIRRQGRPVDPRSLLPTLR